MAIDWTVSHEKRLVTAVIGPKTRRRDYPAFLAALRERGAISYRKIFDLSFGMLDYTVSDVRALGQKVIEWGKGGKPGPVALIASSELTAEFATLYGQHARAERPIRIFADMAEALAWLDEVDPVET